MSGGRRQETGDRRRRKRFLSSVSSVFRLLYSVSCLLSSDSVSSVVRRRSGPGDRLREGGGGKSELRRAVRRVTPGRGNSKESGTENIPLTGAVGLTRRSKQARVKRCGKSAPRVWQQAWQAKPRTEQGQIGERDRLATGGHRTARPRLPGRLLDPVSNDGARGMIVAPKPCRGSRKGAEARRRRTEFGLRPTAAALLFSGGISALRAASPGPPRSLHSRGPFAPLRSARRCWGNIGASRRFPRTPSLASLAGPLRPAPFRSQVLGHIGAPRRFPRTPSLASLAGPLRPAPFRSRVLGNIGTSHRFPGPANREPPNANPADNRSRYC